MKALILVLSVSSGVLGMGSSAFAMLPPYWDRVSQLNAVTQSTEVAAKFGDEIDSVQYISPLTFLISSKDCTMQVELRPYVSSNVGPTTYGVGKMGEKLCK